MSDQQRENDVAILGVHREDRTFVLTDATGTEHAASSPQALWDALTAICDDEKVPKTAVPASDVAEVQGIIKLVQDGVTDVARDRYGEVAGALIGNLARNGAAKVVDFMRRKSR